MGTHIANVAVAGIPEPMPVVLEPERAGQAEDRPDRRHAGRGAGGIAPQGLRGDRRSGPRSQSLGDALSARALGDARRPNPDRAARTGHRWRLRPASASLGPGAALSGTDDL